MEKVLYVGFWICSLIDCHPKGHFSPKEVTKLLEVIPTHYQAFEPEYRGNPRELIPGTSLRASWIYQIGGKYSSSPYLFFEQLIDQILKVVLTETNINKINELKKQYNFTCELHMHHFTDSELINSLIVSEEMITALAEVKGHMALHHHKKPAIEYGAYHYKRIFEL